MELYATGSFMLSQDYKKRFIAEYWQTKIRYEKLKSLNTKLEANSIAKCHGIGLSDDSEVSHTCPEGMLIEQQNIMGNYLHILEVRAVIEGINLNDIYNHLSEDCESFD